MKINNKKVKRNDVIVVKLGNDELGGPSKKQVKSWNKLLKKIFPKNKNIVTDFTVDISVIKR